MALTQISTQGIKDGTITGSDLATNVDLVDNQKLRLGTGNDLEIFHDGTNSGIQNTGGGLFITTSSSGIFLRKNASEELGRFNVDGPVELYYNNNRKFETLNDGVLVTGKVSATGDLALTSSDGQKIRLGQSNDLQIYHDGSKSVIEDSGTGNLEIHATNFSIKNATGDETGIVFDTNAAVELYYDNSKKFETTSSGVAITGNLSFGDNEYALFGASNDLQIYHDGSHSYINDTGTGKLRILTSELLIGNPADNENIAKFIENGAVELYYDNVKKFETTSTGGKLTSSATTNGSIVFDVLSGIRGYVYADNANNIGFLDSDADWLVKGTKDAGVELHFNGSKKFETTSYGARVFGNFENHNGFITVKDDGKFTVGNSDDLTIEHDGSNSRIKNITGQLQIRSNSIALENNDGSDYAAITGLKLLDNAKARFGSSNDLQIFHAGGSHSQIADTTGHQLYITADNALYLQSYTGSENYIKCVQNGAVELYHDNSKKLETLSDGIKVTGAIEAAGVPLQQVFNNTSTSLTKTGTGTVALGFSSMSMTTKRSNSLLVFSYTISGEIDGNRGQCFYRLFYSTSSDYSGEQAVNNTCFQGNSHNVSDGDFSDSGTFHFTNPVSAGTTIYLRMKYSNSNSGASIEFNQQSLSSQPSGTSNISFFRVEELTT